MSTLCLPPLEVLTAITAMSTSPAFLGPFSTLNFSALLKAIQATFHSSRLTIQHIEDIPNDLHHVRLLHLSNGYRIILKVDPPVLTALLKHERHGLEAEALALTLLDQSSLPVPTVLKYEKSGEVLGTPFLITTHVNGVTLSQALPSLTRADRIGIERQISALEAIIAQHTSPTFGPVPLVSSGLGYRSWREAFTVMLESVLKDAEDRFVNLPYAQIRELVVRTGAALDEVQIARLVVLGIRDAENILIDQKTLEITGLVDLKRTLWGDASMGASEGTNGTRGFL